MCAQKRLGEFIPPRRVNSRVGMQLWSIRISARREDRNAEPEQFGINRISSWSKKREHDRVDYRKKIDHVVRVVPNQQTCGGSHEDKHRKNGRQEADTQAYAYQQSAREDQRRERHTKTIRDAHEEKCRYRNSQEQ